MYKQEKNGERTFYDDSKTATDPKKQSNPATEENSGKKSTHKQQPDEMPKKSGQPKPGDEPIRPVERETAF